MTLDSGVDSYLFYLLAGLGMAQLALSFIALESLERGSKSFVLNPLWPYMHGGVFPESDRTLLRWARIVLTLMIVALGSALLF